MADQQEMVANSETPAATPDPDVSQNEAASNGGNNGVSPPQGNGEAGAAAPAENYEVTQNGHLSPTDGMTNGMPAEQSSSPTQNYIPHVAPSAAGGAASGHIHNHRVNSPSGLHRPAGPGVHRGHSPHRYSPNNPHSRGNSPHNPSGAQNQQHVVHVHVNPGETFSVRVGDQIQHIQGPATVRMVSNNGPPLPMPMQVPPGHMVQQIVDENGILTHVILSPQPPGMAAPPMTGGPSSTPQQIYSPYGPQYPPYPHTQYPGPHHHPHPGAPPHMHPVPPPHLHGTPPPHQCNSHTHPHMHPQGPPPPHHNHAHRDDERTQRQKERLQARLRRSKQGEYYVNHAPSSPRRSKGKMNGHDLRRTEPNSSSSSADGQELEEERRIIREILSKMQQPKVSNEDILSQDFHDYVDIFPPGLGCMVIREILSKMQQPKISDIESRSALIQLIPPECDRKEFEIAPTEFKYELLLSDKGRDGKYKSVYSGDATEITLKDLKPATEYHLRVSSMLDDLKGDHTDPVSFRTLSCEPDSPTPPKLSNRTKTSLQLKWNNTADNGSKISSYTLEYDQGQGDMAFVEIYNGLQRQFKVTKLNASVGYTFRLAAINSCGKSEFSETVVFYTCGSAPSQPDPPMLSEPFVKALTISWIKRPNDDEFTLQMEDEATGHGFLTVYNGPDLSYKIKNLRRNTEYRFRLSANNDEGSSKWSDVVCYRTLPDRPSAPLRPQLKGKVHPTCFRIVWDPPKDTGGAEVKQYMVELDDGRGFELVFDGAEREFTCDHLEPGHLYRARVSCTSAGGQSDWSESLSVTTQAVAPGSCQSPKLHGKPKATNLHLRWNYPDYDGGCQVTDFEVLMTLPDNASREVYKGHDLDCTVAGLLPGRSYIFQVRAYNKAGVGPWSESLEVVSGAGVPDPPRLPAVHCKSSHIAYIVWEEPVNNGATITEYRLEWQQKGDGEFTQLYFGSALSYEVRGLIPATLYSFRVQALNSAGAGPFSATASCTTPASSPGSVVSLRAAPTADSVTLTWKEPPSNGSAICSFNIDIGEKQVIPVGSVYEYVIQELMPETTYKIRVQAVNGVGVGPFSAPVKVTTRALPPQPPRLECISSTHNSLKLKWGDGKNPDLIQYVLEMMRDNGSFYPVYHGPSHSHKINKLSELAPYEFLIYASNEAGDGPRSDVYKFSTTKAPPPAVKPPKASEVSLDSCVVDWQPCRPMGSDSIVYCLQLQCVNKDQEYRQIYRGSNTSYRLEGLNSKTEYQARVCAVRQCSDSTGDLMGAYSPGITFNTLSPRLVVPQTTTSTIQSKIPEPKQWTDQQWAMLILAVFALIAILIAFIAQWLIGSRTSSQ